VDGVLPLCGHLLAGGGLRLGDAQLPIVAACEVIPGAAAASAVLAFPAVDRPTALFAANDEMAIGFLKATSAAGHRVPGDFSIAVVLRHRLRRLLRADADDGPTAAPGTEPRGRQTAAEADGVR
jgi:hypothetical protein